MTSKAGCESQWMTLVRSVARRTRITQAVLLVLLLLASPAVGQPQTAPVPLPDTPVGRLARRLVAALNSGETAVQRSFLAAGLDSVALKEGPDDWLRDFTYLYAQTGGLDVVQVLPPKTPDELRFTMRSRRGAYWVRMQTRLSPREPAKLFGYSYGRVESPDTEKQYEWPQGPATERALVHEVERQAAHAAATDQYSGVVLVAKNGHILFHQAYGLADQARRLPNRTNTRFNLGSLNKMFTSVAIAQLVQAGKLSFRDTLANVLPNYPNRATARKITIHQLLTHTAGLGDIFKREYFQNPAQYRTLASYLPLFANDSLGFRPGEGWAYSNAGFLVLGLIIEKVSGQTYFDYVREHIFKPAGMSGAHSFERDAAGSNRAIGYQRPPVFDPLHVQPRQPNTQTLAGEGSSAGGGYSTATDLLHFSHALQQHKLLNADLTAAVTSGKVATDRGAGVQYGYGFFDTALAGRHVVGHGGGAPGLNADLKMCWPRGYTVIVLSNYDAPAATRLSQQIMDFLLRQ